MKTCWQCSSSVPDTYRYCLSCGADVEHSPEKADPLIGQTLVGKFTLKEELGSGAMGTIYKAEQISLGKDVVIKLLHTHLLGDPELVQRFHREARAASRLNHPNCVQIIDFGQTEEGSLYIAMEYIPGVDLATVLERDFPLDFRRTIHILKQVCAALDEAHANGVLHRDLKPENIMVVDRRTENDFVKVVDFGIAKLEDNNPGAKRSFKTRTGIVCGTPEYMSPEQARGKPLDPRSDIYALGVALYHLTTDRLPFDAPSPIEIVTQHLTDRPVPPSNYRQDLPPPLERLILTMLEKDREARPPTIMDVYAELDRIDRELAVARREKIEPNRADDATVIDVRTAALVAQIDANRTAQDRPAAPDEQESTTDETTEGAIRAEASTRVVPGVPASAIRSEEDTVRDRDLESVVGASDTRGSGLAAPPDAKLGRENITIDVSATAGSTLTAEPDDVSFKRSYTWLIVLTLLLVSAAIGVTVWLSTKPE